MFMFEESLLVLLAKHSVLQIYYFVETKKKRASIHEQLLVVASQNY